MFFIKNRTNCINISNNVKELADKLPRTCAEIKIVAIRKSINEGKVKEIRVRRKEVTEALNWLVKHN